MKLSINMTVNSLIPTDDVDRKKGKGKDCYGQAPFIYRQEKKEFVGAESGSYAVSSSGFSFAMQLDVQLVSQLPVPLRRLLASEIEKTQVEAYSGKLSCFFKLTVYTHEHTFSSLSCSLSLCMGPDGVIFHPTSQETIQRKLDNLLSCGSTVRTRCKPLQKYKYTGSRLKYSREIDTKKGGDIQGRLLLRV